MTAHANPTPAPATAPASTTTSTPIQDVLNEAVGAVKKSGGWKKLVGHAIGEVIEVLAGTAVGYGTARAVRQAEMKAAVSHANNLRAEGKHEEAHGFINRVMAAWTQEDEAAEFKVFPRVVKHFNRIGQPAKADQLLATFAGLDQDALNRLGEMLLNCGDEDARYRYLVNWGEAEPAQQAQMLRITRLEVPLEERPGHVFVTEGKRVLTTQLEASNDRVNRLVAHMDEEDKLREKMRKAKKNEKPALLEEWRQLQARRP